MTISQISGLAKLLSASATAPLEFGDVTCISETITIAISAITPIGMTLRMIARIVVRKMASIFQPFSSSPAGAGIARRVNRKIVVMIAGMIRNGTMSLK
ncbi:hypothetical protein D3C80_521000 [compost metagenome]